MCGITGYFSYKKRLNKNVLSQMCDTLTHRGPNDQGTYYFENDLSEVAMGHRRLSIIDLSNGGHQPMHLNALHIVFNGEIYNYQEIRENLKELGYDFKTNSDTEVIINAFDRWGIKAVDRFIGMFSFVILNEETQKIYCFRDRAGVKPFYYYKTHNDFVWASELKAFHKHPAFVKSINSEALELYLEYGYIPAPFTIFKGAHKLKPGHYIEIDISTNDFIEQAYWDVNDIYAKPKIAISESDAMNELEDLLISSCNYRMVADVPVGVFLSGGYDSTVVAAILQKDRVEKIKTFTIGFNDAEFDEAPFAKQIAEHLGTEHYELYCTENEAKKVIPILPLMYDEPFGDSSAIPTYLVSKMAKQKVTVALSADGGDETFFGYNKYPAILKRFNQFNNLSSIKRKILNLGMPIAELAYHKNSDKLRKLSLIKTAVNNKNFSMLYLNSTWTKRFHQNGLNNLLKRVNGAASKTYFNDDVVRAKLINPIDQLLATDYKTYLVDDILVKVDRSTMAVSLEGREPLLDHRLIEFAATLPNSLHFKNGLKKYLLKEIAHKYVPKHLLDRPKSGFAIPLQKWFRSDMKYLLDDFLNSKYLTEQGIFNPEYVERLLKEYYSGNDNVFDKIWFLLMFQMWFKEWME